MLLQPARCISLVKNVTLRMCTPLLASAASEVCNIHFNAIVRQHSYSTPAEVSHVVAVLPPHSEVLYSGTSMQCAGHSQIVLPACCLPLLQHIIPICHNSKPLVMHLKHLHSNVAGPAHAAGNYSSEVAQSPLHYPACRMLAAPSNTAG